MSKVPIEVKVTAPLNVSELEADTVQAPAGEDLTIQGRTGKDIILKLPDAAGARKVIIKDSADETVGSIDSNGVFTASQFVGPVPYAHSDTDGAPTNAELISAFGAVATVGAGFRGVFKDDHAVTGKRYLIICDGAAYYTIEATAAA